MTVYWKTSEVRTSETSFQNRHLWAYGAVLCALSFLITGYGIYRSNQSIQIPLVLLLQDPSLYPIDPFASTLPYYASMLWRIVALLNRIVPIEPLFLFFFILERCLLMYGSARLAQAYAPGSTLAAIGTMGFFAMAPKPFVGAGTIVINYFEQTGLSIPFFMLAVASFYQSRPISAAVWLSIGFNLNSMYGTYALTYLGSAFLVGWPHGLSWKKWALCVILFILLSSPAILLSASAFSVNSTDKNLWLLTSRLLFPYHLYPLTNGAKSFLIFCAFVLVTILFLRHCKKDLERLYKFSIGWTAVALAWLACAFVAAYVAKSPSMLILHPARGIDLWYCLVGTALICACAAKVESNLKRKQFYTAIFFVFVLFWHPNYFLLLLPILLVLFLKPAWNAVLKMGDPIRLAQVLIFMILLLSVYIVQARVRSRGTALHFKPDESLVELAHWAKETTDPRATFLIHPFWGEFRALSHRGVFVTLRDGAAMLWYRNFVHEWSKRLFALGYDVRNVQGKGESMHRDINRLYDAFNDQQVTRLKNEFTIHYWIVPVEHNSSFPIAFQNQKHKVLDLN